MFEQIFKNIDDLLYKDAGDDYYNVNEKYNSYTAFGKGFLTDILNPKATLFFLSIYTIIIINNPSTYIQLAYGLWMAIATAAWFCFLSIVLTKHKITKKRFLGLKFKK